MNANTILPAALLCTALLGGCGGGTNVQVQGTTTISKGQELTDLQRALNDGAITQSEYDAVRAKIMKRPN
jgi:hypothetical protein